MPRTGTNRGTGWHRLIVYLDFIQTHIKADDGTVPGERDWPAEMTSYASAGVCHADLLRFLGNGISNKLLYTGTAQILGNKRN